MATSLQGLADGLTDRKLHKVCLNIKFSPRQSYMLDVGTETTIRELKEMVAERAHLAANNINLVLAGQVLRDQIALQSMDLGAHTTLHAFCWSDDGLKSPGVVPEVQLAPKVTHTLSSSQAGPLQSQQSLEQRGESDVDGDISQTGPSQSQQSLEQRRDSNVDGDTVTEHSNTEEISSIPNDNSSFFIYCKLCACIQRGRLRVKCRQCESGAFLVDRGPDNWDDISYSSRIRGSCKSCGANIPIFYFRCIQSHLEEVVGTVAVLKHVRANRRRVECIICEDINSHILVFPCAAGHVICLDCFRQYSFSCLSERRFLEHPMHGYSILCPAGCEDSHIEDSHHFLLMGKEKYERYKNFGAEEYVLQNGGMLCPAPGCGMGLFPEGDDRTVCCGECQHESCRECHREPHPGNCDDYFSSQLFDISDLSVDDERAARACWDRQSLSFIEETTKKCPSCKTKTERDGGCMHMVCSRCGEEWCWICVKQWNRNCQADHWFGL